MHCFELRTANVDYFVGEEPVAVKDKAPVVNPPETGVGMDLAKVSLKLKQGSDTKPLFITEELTFKYGNTDNPIRFDFLKVKRLFYYPNVLLCWIQTSNTDIDGNTSYNHLVWNWQSS